MEVRDLVIGDGDLDDDVDIADLVWTVDMIGGLFDAKSPQFTASDVYLTHGPSAFTDSESESPVVNDDDANTMRDAILSGFWGDGLPLGSTLAGRFIEPGFGSPHGDGPEAVVTFETYPDFVALRLTNPMLIRGLQIELQTSNPSAAPGVPLTFARSAHMEVKAVTSFGGFRMLLFSRENQPIPRGDGYILRIPTSVAKTFRHTGIRLQAVDNQNQPVAIRVGWQQGSELPIGHRLATSQPNPFSTTTTIVFQIPDSERVRIEIFSSAGQQVRTLLDAALDPGTHRVVWDGRDDSGRTVGAGVYFLQLAGRSFVGTERITRIRRFDAEGSR